jgi:hypothetical protein
MLTRSKTRPPVMMGGRMYTLAQVKRNVENLEDPALFRRRNRQSSVKERDPLVYCDGCCNHTMTPSEALEFWKDYRLQFQ